MQTLRAVFIAVALLAAALPALAQAPKSLDVLLLKDSTVIRGSIIGQQPGEWVRILMLGGSVLVVRQRDIERISVEPSPYRRSKLRYNRQRLRQAF
jgi:hypothetical protein